MYKYIHTDRIEAKKVNRVNYVHENVGESLTNSRNNFKGFIESQHL